MTDTITIEVTRYHPAHDDERRRYYRITPPGRLVAEAEARRLVQLVDMARAARFVPESGR